MQSVIATLPSVDLEIKPKKIVFNWYLFISIAALIVSGSFTYSTYSPPVNAIALVAMVGLFYYNLHKQDPVSFFIQLFVGNFFVFGYKFGGNYNIAAFASIIFYSVINGRTPFLRSSVFSNAIKTAIAIWCIFELLSVTGGNFFPLFTELQNFFAFCMMVYLFYFVSRIPFTPNDFYKIILAISIFFIYEFLVAINQKYSLYNSPFPFFPSGAQALELDIVRSSSTLDNFEAFAEFCVSLISLLLPGLISGSSSKQGKPFYYFSIFIILIALMSIVYSGTRSSILLLPLAFIGSFIFLGRKLKTKMILLLTVATIGVLLLNMSLKFVDFSVFTERSEDMDNVTLTNLLNGEAMNRGGLFPYAFNQVKQTTGIIGKGYFISPDEYRQVQFGRDEKMFDNIADYHNLYMSTFVMFGPIGFAAMMFLFLYPLIDGWRTYWAFRKKPHFTIDLLLGFNLLFVILLINQFKIQFIRYINYFTITMLLLVLYISLTWQVKQLKSIAEFR